MYLAFYEDRAKSDIKLQRSNTIESDIGVCIRRFNKILRTYEKTAKKLN